MQEAGDAIVVGVERNLSRVLQARVAVIADAWGRLDTGERTRLDADARAASDIATQRVVLELRTLFALDPVEQRATPLEIVRASYREPSAVLTAAGIPGVVRDPFDERAWPDDDYGLVVRTLADLDDELGPMQLAWGLAKAGVLRAER